MKLPDLKSLPLVQKTVLLRVNYDVPLTGRGQVADPTRIEESLPTIEYLLSQRAKIILLSHLGRPGGRFKKGLSLRPTYELLAKLLPDVKVRLSPQVVGPKTDQLLQGLEPAEILMLENLRFDPDEEKNSRSLAKKLASLGDFFINDAFAVAHRRHASVVGIPLFLKTAFGFDFLEEVATLSRVREKPKRPVVVILGGAKKSKVEAIKRFLSWADEVLVGGQLVYQENVPQLIESGKVIGSLTKAGEDITMKTVRLFKRKIKSAKTVIWSGPLGPFEQRRYRRGTKRVAQAVARSKAEVVVGGGDTEAALSQLGLEKKIGYVSSGGGAMLAFLTKGTLPGIEAVLRRKK